MPFDARETRVAAAAQHISALPGWHGIDSLLSRQNPVSNSFLDS
jgi:hypothetical protein